MKKLLMGVTVAVLFTCLTASCSRLNTRIGQKIEAGGSELTGVPVGVDRVNLRIFRGSGQITGLTVANPDGYEDKNAFQMDLLRLNLGVLSLLPWFEPIVLDELVIESPILNLEMNEQGGSNLGDISDNVAKNLEQADHKSEETEPASDKSSGKPRRIAIRKLVIDGVTFSMRGIDGIAYSGTLPTIELTDVGGSEGKTPGGLCTVVTIAMAREMLKEALARKLFESVEGLGSQEVDANWRVFDAEKIVDALEQRLNLSNEQQVKLQAVIEMAIQDLNKTMSEQAGHSYLDLESLSNQLKVIAEAAQKQLEDVLDSEQISEVRTYLAKLDEDAIEEIRKILVEKISSFLSITPEQIDRFQLVFWEELEKRNEMLSRFAREPDVSFEEFINNLEALQKETRRRLEGALDTDQMKVLKKRQDELMKIFRRVFTSDG